MNDTDTSSGHKSVLLHEAISALQPQPGGVYLDATFGGGGHTRALLDVEPKVGTVFAVDADQDAVARADALAFGTGVSGRVRAIQANFGDLRALAQSNRLDRLDGVLFDLGLSSFQLDDADRGFAFRFNAPLDMRYDRTSGQSAMDLVNTISETELASIIWKYGEERKSRKIAAAIVRSREDEPLSSTRRLAQIVERVAGDRGERNIHPATRTFQALRIKVNAELEMLASALPAAVDLLNPGGRLVVISFHSLEDRLVKQFIAAESTTCICPPAQPICTCDTVPRLRRIGKALKPSSDESARNPRSRSAIMRIAERLDRYGHAFVRAG